MYPKANTQKQNNFQSSSIPNSNTHKTEFHAVFMRQKAEGKKTGLTIKMPVTIQRNCQYHQKDEQLIICQTYFLFSSTAMQTRQNLNINQFIQTSNKSASSTPAFLRPRICNLDPSDDKFLICNQKVPLDKSSKQHVQKISRIQKIDYFRTITARLFFYPQVHQPLKIEMNHQLQSIFPSRTVKAYVQRLNRLRIFPFIVTKQVGQIEDWNSDKIEYLARYPTVSIQKDSELQLPALLGFIHIKNNDDLL